VAAACLLWTITIVSPLATAPLSARSIIEPIASRCSKFRFKPLDEASMLGRLRTISTSEGVEASDDTLKEVGCQCHAQWREVGCLG